jgi:hypothetical protein
MIFRLLTNINYLIYFFCIFVIGLLLTYLIYKLFIIENDLFIVNEKLNKIELEFNHPSNLIKGSDVNHEKQNSFNLTEIIMNEVFNTNDKRQEKTCLNNKCHLNEEDDNRNNSIDIDVDIINEVIEEKPIEKEVIFDLKKDVITNDNESIISGGVSQNMKKKLLKLNLDKLKEKCQERNLSVEGTKAQLIDRIYDDITKEKEV